LKLQNSGSVSSRYARNVNFVCAAIQVNQWVFIDIFDAKDVDKLLALRVASASQGIGGAFIEEIAKSYWRLNVGQSC
jgi:hypothetical protein